MPVWVMTRRMALYDISNPILHAAKCLHSIPHPAIKPLNWLVFVVGGPGRVSGAAVLAMAGCRA